MPSRVGVRRSVYLIVTTLLLWPRAALAGMPAPIVLTDIARMRVETISFFLVILLLSAAIIQRIWNYLRESFPRVPRLNYWRALALVALWGLLFIIVLAMISGGRELMTPGAWERNGVSYRLVPPSATEPSSQTAGSAGGYPK